ncbi:MAG: hypothetical protein MZW92_38435 [Comamonadaceae bacterium]|nr:hypothetical protein [Comamonadaceae bacterium]
MPLLAVERGARRREPPGWTRLQAFGAIAGVIVIGRYLTRPALRLIAATRRARDVHRRSPCCW